ncbi:iroquois-class homeodomain protein irx-1-B isoform X2 [Teleopsis dalmanni]|uniref:iroquois-class homeodomain protein irx-1-B isoform X2 n=1 Tax=Teleopsis dalmanni TaxID=139649 RepID=UPI0018CFD631|nr:iroquois-class homeodomain protein irx-1-B isoform X2 [Teleopsis dalmanni]
MKNPAKRSWLTDQPKASRPPKRLFTPEIKRMLKEWLVRRRDNPYPNREEKKELSLMTGLTYTQVCNWFANWRRKLKNSEHEQKTWGQLIKNYNSNARGNVEQFSISSENSIWEEDGHSIDFTTSDQSDSSLDDFINDRVTNDTDNNFTRNDNTSTNRHREPQLRSYFYENKLSEEQQYKKFKFDSDSNKIVNTATTSSMVGNASINYNYKHKIIAKYMRDVSDEKTCDASASSCSSSGTASTDAELSKWLKSAEEYTPRNNYFIDWTNRGQAACCKPDQIETKPKQNEDDSDNLQLEDIVTENCSPLVTISSEEYREYRKKYDDDELLAADALMILRTS